MSVLEDKLFGVESASETIVKEDETFKCKECNFIGKNEKGVNIHTKGTHGPSYNCDLCDESFSSKRLLKIHRNSHSYNSKYKGRQFEKQDCKKCDYTCKDIEDMEVHIGKGCLHLFECGLCDDKFDKTEDLETN